MRLWFVPVSIVLAALASLWFYTRTSEEGSPPADPMVWASDDWVQWQRWPGGSGMGDDLFGLGCPTWEVPRNLQELSSRGAWWSGFESAEGEEVWHADERWESLPVGWDQQPWRGGFLAGTPVALGLWSESPGDMAKHWRDAEQGAMLRRTDVGWEWWGGGWVVWPNGAADSGSGSIVGDDPQSGSASVDLETGRLWDVHPSQGLGDTWIGRLGDEPSCWAMPSVEARMRDHGVPLQNWGTRWASGGRWHVGDSAVWMEPIRALGQVDGWGVHFVGEDVVVDATRDGLQLATLEWFDATRDRKAWVGQHRWHGSPSLNRSVVWHVHDSPEAMSLQDEVEGSLASSGTADNVAWTENSPADLGFVGNHLTGGQLRIVRTALGVGAFDDSGQRVWEVASEDVLPAWAVQVDVYRNGKYQTAFSTREACHVVDVKGREVPGFPIVPQSGDVWTSMAVVDYDANANHRFLLASEKTGRILNYRGEGETTPGWSHQPVPGIDASSPVRHIQHLRLGSRDYVYVGRDNGQVELLRRTGEPRAQTPVRVNPRHPPLFRKGRDLDGTSVLFIDELGWVREFTLGQGDAVGLSGMIRADRLDMMDLDGDGRDEVVTWLRGERTVWNARNEKVE